MHLDAHHTLTLTRLAAPAFGVEREAAGAEAAHARLGKLGEEIADVREQIGIGRGVRARRAADRILIDTDDAVEKLASRKLIVGPGLKFRSVQRAREGAIDRIDHEAALARARDAGHAGERSEGNFDIDVFQIMRPRAFDREPPAVATSPPLGNRYLQVPGEIPSRERRGVGGDLLRRSLRHDLAAVDPGARAHVDHVVGRDDRLAVVLDDDDRVAALPQFAEQREQPLVVARMQADARLVQHVKHADESRTDLRRQAHALTLAAGKRGGGAVEAQIVEADAHEKFQAVGDLAQDALGDGAFARREVEFGEESERGADRLRGNLRDVFPVDQDVKRLFAQTRAFANLTKRRIVFFAFFFFVLAFFLIVDEKKGQNEEEESEENYASLCQVCKGTRLRKEALYILIDGKNIAEVSAKPISAALAFFSELDLSSRERAIAERILREIADRLKFLVRVGLDYLSLDRAAATLSGGESQRVRLATEIGSGLVGVLYVLDEPSVGLHPRDNERLLALLRELRQSGNSVVVVEHDREAIVAADHVIDMGPGAGVDGGEVVAQGTPKEIAANAASLTGRYLSGDLEIPIPERRRSGDSRRLTIEGARAHNLKNIDVEIPLGTLTCVTGVSGSGKSSLVIDTIYRALARALHGAELEPGPYDQLSGGQFFDSIVSIDQNPIGRTPRSNPATYTDLFPHIRDLFAQLPEARMRGFGPGRFSFNAKGGRCEACQGEGMVRIEMHFLPDVYVPCAICRGRRYNRETLEILYKGRNIADVLDLTVNEALEFLSSFPAIRRRLETLRDVGMGYVRLGQPATTLSGGEAQRIKLARELSKRSTGSTLYILDEPTTGLHFDDIRKLLDVLNRLADAGNTVLVIEHNLDMIKAADFVLDLGPEGGAAGGEVLACGTPEQVAAAENSYTGRYLNAVLKSAGSAGKSLKSH